MGTEGALADKRKRQPRGDARREQILEAALELFSERGYRGSGLGALAEKVGVTTPALLYYFGTKERLLHAVVTRREELERASYSSTATPLDNLRSVARFIRTNPMLTRLFVVLGAENLDPADPLHDFFVKRYRRSRKVTEAAVLDEVEHGRFRADVDHRQLAREVVATMMGLEIQWLMDPKAFDLEATIAAYVDGLRERLAPGR
jgi:AcrR family transcriptional regulator